MIKRIIFVIFLGLPFVLNAQGYNHQWLLGSQILFSVPKGRMIIDSATYSVTTEFRKMPFYGTQGNICDNNGNFLMSSNGVWIANANNDTMLNGAGLNPGQFVDDWSNGLPMLSNSLFLPFPGDSSKYILIHHSATFNGNYYPAFDVFSSIIDLTLDSGLGGVKNKNTIILSDTLNWGIGACKHANGRDWWIVMMKDSSDIIYKILLTPGGITNISTQHLLFNPIPWGSGAQLSFSNDGRLFSSTTSDSFTPNSYSLLFDFDRCTGLFSNSRVIPLTINHYIWGLAFSPSGKYLYSCSSNHIFQISTDSLIVDTVATYDGYYSPDTNCCATTFWNMYLAANGKIYVTSGSGVQHIHEINYPDSAGVACDVQQHAINLGVWNLRAVPNHPNYYLGPVIGSGCDTLTSVDGHLNEIVNFAVSPNPNSGNFNIIYLLPQNKEGDFEVFDVMGKKVFKMDLPAWSTLQNIHLPPLSDGVYNAVIKSGYDRVCRKIVVMQD